MSRDERKRQKSLAKKKLREHRIRKQMNIARNPSAGDVLQSMLRGGWYKCVELSSQGISNLLCICQVPGGFSACAFLVDWYCLGVKDVSILRRIDVSMISDKLKTGEGLEVSPQYAFKNILTAIEEARKIGFEPHPKTAMALKLFAGVDASACSEEFAFGLNGKPTFIAGPYDDQVKIQQVLTKLKALGEGNYDYVLPVDMTEIDASFEAILLGDDSDESFDFDDDQIIDAESVKLK